VTDIGVDTLVRQVTDRHTHPVPSNWMYKPGEELRYGIRTSQTDIYSFATAIYSVCVYYRGTISVANSPHQIYALEPPYPSNTHSYGRGLMEIINQGHDGIFGKSQPARMSNELWEIIRMCWALDPSQRPSMSEVEGKLRRMCGLN
jgi:hypothetical protein